MTQTIDSIPDAIGSAFSGPERQELEVYLLVVFAMRTYARTGYLMLREGVLVSGLAYTFLQTAAGQKEVATWVSICTETFAALDRVTLDMPSTDPRGNVHDGVGACRRILNVLALRLERA